MARKVFISFLGAIPYGESRYYIDDINSASSPTPYAQIAIFEKHLLPIWEKDDEIYIFTTNDAHTNNYENRIMRYDTKEQKVIFSPQKDGLKNAFQKMKAEGGIEKFEAIEIPNGNTVKEIWEVFQLIYNKLAEHRGKTELYFDVTYGFRSLPMLGIVLLNYLKTLSDIDIKHIFYGNYEVGRQERDKKVAELQKIAASEISIKEMKDAIPVSPILDLRPFVELQEWTTAARAFVDGGNTQLLKTLIAQTNSSIAEKLDIFSMSILMCRGQQLNRDFDVDQFKQELTELPNEEISVQLKPILNKIKEKISPFKSKNTLNGMVAVEWCITNGLIQQGYTFLQETLKSYVIENVFLEEELLDSYLIDHSIRMLASTALDGTKLVHIEDKIENLGSPSDYLSIKNKKKVYANKLWQFVKNKNLAKYYTNLTAKGKGLRNDINHCGFQKNYASPTELKTELQELLHNFKKQLSL